MSPTGLAHYTYDLHSVVQKDIRPNSVVAGLRRQPCTCYEAQSAQRKGQVFPVFLQVLGPHLAVILPPLHGLDSEEGLDLISPKVLPSPGLLWAWASQTPDIWDGILRGGEGQPRAVFTATVVSEMEWPFLKRREDVWK